MCSSAYQEGSGFVPVHWFVCEQDYTQTTKQITVTLGMTQDGSHYILLQIRIRGRASQDLNLIHKAIKDPEVHYLEALYI